MDTNLQTDRSLSPCIGPDLCLTPHIRLHHGLELDSHKFCFCPCVQVHRFLYSLTMVTTHTRLQLLDRDRFHKPQFRLHYQRSMASHRPGWDNHMNESCVCDQLSHRMSYYRPTSRSTHTTRQKHQQHVNELS